MNLDPVVHLDLREPLHWLSFSYFYIGIIWFLSTLENSMQWDSLSVAMCKLWLNQLNAFMFSAPSKDWAYGPVPYA